ncbi:alkaline-phosphatase-like protein [Gymnopilus junonius]|uniref:Alkaline-phosphatase-like protein n=1 Tax=Gymnopilus junonius TaxID=109634 RepID=A0A9P5TQQ1_GYMJU|nr:alkaline-phosphatase-like protein [Gymnopilus junonius]
MGISRLYLLIWVFLIHVAGIYLFTRGFLLTRLSLSNTSTCSEPNCGIIPTHQRAVLLIIDSLRFDFVSPDPPTPQSPFHHNVLTLPRELTEKHPKHSFIFNSYADPPTTTLQRIKGITTGSLPTFVDIGNSFGGSSIAEDSILKQLKSAGKKVPKLAFMGDDTWMSVFPDTFEPNMRFPYDSFNVEDLHTVDEGPFDFLIGHFLGVDHVGHRVSPYHPSMKTKLQQMNDVLSRVVELLEEDTLLVVLGDHGMDRSGDHGGDSPLETSAGMWIYSKGPPLTDLSPRVPGGLLQFKIFPGCDTRHRSIQQIDILPTMSLLLGVPIPFNNLGTVIPELFWRGNRIQTLRKVLEANTVQIMRYLDTYRSSPSGGELDEAWHKIQEAWKATQTPGVSSDSELVTLMNFNRVALSACRAMWAQFNPLLMSLGLSLLSMGFCASKDWDGWLSPRLVEAVQVAAGGAVLGAVGHFFLGTFTPGVNAFDWSIFIASLVSSITFILLSPPKIDFETIKSTPIILLLHSIAFLSNSFTFWEDRIVSFLLMTSLVPYVLTGISAPSKRLRYRILGFSLLYAVCVRLMATSTPYCHVTFFASSSLAEPSKLVLYLCLPAAVSLPYFIKRILRITRSDTGLAKTYLPLFLVPTLIGGSLFWIMEWADSASILGDDWPPALRFGRTWIARFSFGWILLAGGALWLLIPLCLNIEVSTEGGKRQIKVLGYANAFGIFLALVYICTQLTGQVVLILATVLDSARDARGIQAAFESSTPSSVLDAAASLSLSPSIRFADIVPIALLGHQSTISSLQLKTAFMLTPTVAYPFSAITIVINNIGPVFLFALAVPLTALWNRAPLATPEGQPERELDVQVKGESTLAALGMMIYYSALLLGTSVFAPRFIAAALELLAVDIGILLGVGVGLERVVRRLRTMFGARKSTTAPGPR